MASPSYVPPPPAGPLPPRPYAPQAQSLAVVAVIAIIVVFFIFFMTTLFTGFTGGFAFPTLMVAPFCAVAFVVVLIIALGVSQGTYRSRIPPPPPIQQPMVPAGMQGPVALNCPNCGAPPTVVDRFGVATCTYCNTRFLVR